MDMSTSLCVQICVHTCIHTYSMLEHLRMHDDGCIYMQKYVCLIENLTKKDAAAMRVCVTVECQLKERHITKELLGGQKEGLGPC